MSRITFKHNRLLDFFVMFFIPYHWAYKHGVVDGMKKSDYFKGYADGQEETHKFYRENCVIKLRRKR